MPSSVRRHALGVLLLSALAAATVPAVACPPNEPAPSATALRNPVKSLATPGTLFLAGQGTGGGG